MAKDLASRLLATENLPIKDAAAYLKAPKEGKGYQPLLRPWKTSEEPRAKRPRNQEAVDEVAEGMVSFGTNNIAPNPSVYFLGTFQPYAAWHKTKYNPEGANNFANQLIASSLIPYDDSLATEAKKCIMASLSRKTWAKDNSAWNAFRKFEESLGTPFTWPLPEVAYRGFATWCIRVKKLTAATAKVYITALTTAHTLAGLEDTAVKPGKLTHHILARGKNLETFDNSKHSTRRSINLTVLKILGHRLAVSS
jgi:hypothetical protein